MCHAQGATDFKEDVGTISVIGRGEIGFGDVPRGQVMRGCDEGATAE